MWTEITRRKYEREGQRYASDLTDAEWALIEPHMPPAKRLGRPRETELRDVLDAILYIARTGCQWRMLPKEFPPFTTVQGYFYDWRDNGLFESINFHLLLQAREAAGRDASPCRSTMRLVSSWPSPSITSRVNKRWKSRTICDLAPSSVIAAKIASARCANAPSMPPISS